MTPSPEPLSPSSKQQGVLNWKCLGFYVTRQLMWRQTPNLFITATEITRTGYYTKKSSNRSIVPYVLRDPCHEIFCVFGDFSASRTQDAEVTKLLHCRKKFTVLWSLIVIHKVLVRSPNHTKWIRGYQARQYIDQLTHYIGPFEKRPTTERYGGSWITGKFCDVRSGRK